MKVEIISIKESEFENNGYRDQLTIKINGKKVFQVRDGEPEDNNLWRNFKDCFKIDDLLKMAFEAGSKGKNLEIVYSKSDKFII
jgi:hypothetical protein